MPRYSPENIPNSLTLNHENNLNGFSRKNKKVAPDF
jgi:hypothetical protein